MLSYFRINDPYRIISVFIILVLFRLPFILTDNPLTIPELNSMLLGEKLAAGNTLYTEIWDSTGPLSALVYWMVYTLFGRSLLAFQLVALLLVTLQCLLFNRLMLVNKAYNENTYVPGIVYGISMSVFFDFFSLSPALMANTFVLLALNNIFGHVELRAKRDESILNIGLYLGLAAMFYLPTFVFGIATGVVFLLLTGTVLRRYMLFAYGYLLPFLFLLCYFFLHDGLGGLYFNFFSSLFRFGTSSFMGITSLLVILAVPTAYLIMSLVRISQRRRFTNYQVRLVQIMFIWFVFALFSLLFAQQGGPSNFIIFVPPFAFFLSHYFLLIGRNLLKELAFSIFLVMVVVVNHGVYFDFSFAADLVDYRGLLVKQSPLHDTLLGKDVLVIGNSRDEYKDAKHSTPYLNWDISSEVFQKLDYYDNLTHIYKSFQEKPPQLIIDHENLMPMLFEKLPTIESRYQKLGSVEHVYQLKTRTK